jgi:hypothetical protein
MAVQKRCMCGMEGPIQASYQTRQTKSQKGPTSSKNSWTPVELGSNLLKFTSFPALYSTFAGLVKLCRRMPGYCCKHALYVYIVCLWLRTRDSAS